MHGKDSLTMLRAMEPTRILEESLITGKTALELRIPIVPFLSFKKRNRENQPIWAKKTHI